MIPLLLAIAGAPEATLASDVRLAIAIGSDVGVEGEKPLSFAEEDAKRFRDVLVEVGGVSSDRAYLVTGSDASEVRRVISEAKGRLLELSQIEPTSLIVYVSSHADESDLHLDGSRLPLDELKSLVASMPAALRLLIVDACRTPNDPGARSLGGRSYAVMLYFEHPALETNELMLRFQVHRIARLQCKPNMIECKELGEIYPTMTQSPPAEEAQNHERLIT